MILSEYAPKTKAKSQYFLERNRIVSGISLGVLIIEAKYRSGTSVTARFATKQKRKVFVLPHEIEDKYGVGTNKLIKNGAKLVTSTEEIIKSFDFLTYKKIDKENKLNNTIIAKQNIKNAQYKQVYELFSDKIISINEICKKLNKEVGEVSSILLMLEIEGYIKKVAGGYKCV